MAKVQCLICKERGVEFFCHNLGQHLSAKHGIKSKDYLKKYGGKIISSEFRKKVLRNRKYLDKAIAARWRKPHKKKSKIGKVPCLMCRELGVDFYARDLSAHIRFKHQINCQEYERQTGGKSRSSLFRKQISKKFRQLWRDGTFENRNTEYATSVEYKKKRSAIIKRTWESGALDDLGKKISSGIASGRIKVNSSVKGLFKKRNGKLICFDSGYEFMRMKQLDDSHIDFTRCDFTIPYLLNGKRRYYVPDLFFTFKGNTVVEEVKASEFRSTKEVIEKVLAATKYCRQKGWFYHIVDEKQIDKKGVYRELLKLAKEKSS